MNDIKTGSTEAAMPLPQRQPGASFATHGDPDAAWNTPTVAMHTRHRSEVRSRRVIGRRGRHRAPKTSLGWKSLLAVLGITALAVGSCGAPAPAAPKVVLAPAPQCWTADLTTGQHK